MGYVIQGVYYVMATFRKLASGKWFAEVCKKNRDNGIQVRKTATGYTKREVKDWADELERKISDGSYWKADLTGKTFGDLLVRYRDEVTIKKRGKKKETIRINRFLREDPICDIPLTSLRRSDFASWRDSRSSEVSNESVNRELSILSNALNIAVDEWEWLSESPTRGLKRLKKGNHRERRISSSETEMLMYVMGYDHNNTPTTSVQRVAAAFLFALDTGMRSGDICGLEWGDINYKERYANIEIDKNGKGRKVPLFDESLRILKQLKPCGFKTCFGLTDGNRDALFRRYRDKTTIADLHWHDTKHEACYRLAQTIHVMDLARIVGTNDLKKLMIYYNPTPMEIIERVEGDK